MKRLVLLFFLFKVCFANGQELKFENISKLSGIRDFGKNYGVAIGDYDNDGDEDVYVSRTDHNNNLLYENLGEFQFEEKGQKAGINNSGSSYHSVWGDINNDGFLDLYVANRNEPNALYLNNGDGTFEDITEQAGVGNADGAVSALFGDIDNDGWIDIYVANINAQNVLYRNQGDNTFTDVTLSSGAVDELIAMGTTFIDFDNDNDLDLYLSHDAEQANILYENDGTGVFKDISEAAGADYEGYGMGTAFGDFNNDGFYDLYITNLYENTLLINNQDKTFKDMSSIAGVDDYGMGWGVSCLDYNNDGFQDIYAVNNSYFSPYSNVLYQNLGDGNFETVSNGTELESKYAGFGVGCADFNGDGWVDLFVANSGSTGGNQLFRNTGSEGHWATFKMQGTSSNRSGIGTKISVTAGELKLMDQVAAGGGYASQNSLILHFGLKNEETIEELTVTWPSGIEDVYFNIDVNQHYLIEEGKSIEVREALNTVTSIEPENPRTNVTIYPMPADTHLSITLDRPIRLLAASLTTMTGQTIPLPPLNYDENNSGTSTIALPSNLTNGLYFITLETDAQSITRRLKIRR